MAYEIELKELPDRYVVTIRVETTPDQLGGVFQELLPEVDAQILAAGAPARRSRSTTTTARTTWTWRPAFRSVSRSRPKGA